MARSWLTRRATWLALGGLLVFSVLTRGSIWKLPVQIFRDSPGYLVPALSLLDGHGYGIQENGFRTPTYPLFLALIVAPFNRAAFSDCRDAHDAVCLQQATGTRAGANALRAIVLMQMMLGLGITVLLFALGWHLTRNVFVALLFGAGYMLNPATAFWEISLLTETLTTFLLVASVALTFRIARGQANLRNTTALGLLLGALALCHSLFLVYWFFPAAYLFLDAWRKKTRTLRNSLRRVSPLLLIPALFLLLWSSFNYAVNDNFTPSTLSGYVLIQMVAPVVQNAPEGYDGLTQIYIGYRDAMIRETGSYSGAIFRAWSAIMRETDLTFSALSRKLTALSLYLIVAYPSSYTNVAREGWSRFWDFPFYHYAPVPPGPARWLLGFTDAKVQTGLNILFWLVPLALGIVYLQRRRSTFAIPFAEFFFLAVTIYYAASVVALTNFEDNARFHSYVLPFQYGIVVVTLWALWQTCAHLIPLRMSKILRRAWVRQTKGIG